MFKIGDQVVVKATFPDPRFHGLVGTVVDTVAEQRFPLRVKVTGSLHGDVTLRCCERNLKAFTATLKVGDLVRITDNITKHTVHIRGRYGVIKEVLSDASFMMPYRVRLFSTAKYVEESWQFSKHELILVESEVISIPDTVEPDVVHTEEEKQETLPTLKVGDSVSVVAGYSNVFGMKGRIVAINFNQGWPHSPYTIRLDNGSLRYFRQDELKHMPPSPVKILVKSFSSRELWIALFKEDNAYTVHVKHIAFEQPKPALISRTTSESRAQQIYSFWLGKMTQKVLPEFILDNSEGAREGGTIRWLKRSDTNEEATVNLNVTNTSTTPMNDFNVLKGFGMRGTDNV